MTIKGLFDQLIVLDFFSHRRAPIPSHCVCYVCDVLICCQTNFPTGTIHCIVLYCIVFLLLTAHFELSMVFETHFKLQQPTLIKTVSILSAPFSRNGHSTTKVVRGHNFTLALCTVLNPMPN